MSWRARWSRHECYAVASVPSQRFADIFLAGHPASRRCSSRHLCPINSLFAPCDPGAAPRIFVSESVTRDTRSPWRWLLAKEWRELIASRSWWIMLLLIGPLVGVSFISAVRTYAEASGLNGTAAGVGEAFSPLVGIWAPTFSACELAAAFLLPFVAIRLVAGDRQSGALKIELQHGMPSIAR